MSQYINPAISSIQYAALISLHDEDRDLRFNPRFDWNYRRRGPSTSEANLSFSLLWPRSCYRSGDPSTAGMFGQQAGDYSSYEPWIKIATGLVRPYFLRGQCKDSIDVAVPGAVVQGFRTLDDLFVGQTIADDGGFYSLGTNFTADQHYLVAYKPGSPDIAGTTVNTLTPSL